MFCAQKLMKESIYMVEYILLYFIVSWSTLTSVYSSTLLAMVHAIWRFHWFEFHRHWRRILLVYATTMLSTVTVLIYAVYNLYFLLCTGDLISKPYTLAFYDPLTPYIGICYPVVWFASEMAERVGDFAAFNLTMDMSILIPVIVFVVLDKPHDCFVCLGKDPERVYSIFQLKREERYERTLFAKGGKALTESLRRNNLNNSTHERSLSIERTQEFVLLSRDNQRQFDSLSVQEENLELEHSDLEKSEEPTVSSV